MKVFDKYTTWRDAQMAVANDELFGGHIFKGLGRSMGIGVGEGIVVGLLTTALMFGVAGIVGTISNKLDK